MNPKQSSNPIQLDKAVKKVAEMLRERCPELFEPSSAHHPDESCKSVLRERINSLNNLSALCSMSSRWLADLDKSEEDLSPEIVQREILAINVFLMEQLRGEQSETQRLLEMLEGVQSECKAS